MTYLPDWPKSTGSKINEKKKSKINEFCIFHPILIKFGVDADFSLEIN